MRIAIKARQRAKNYTLSREEMEVRIEKNIEKIFLIFLNALLRFLARM